LAAKTGGSRKVRVDSAKLLALMTGGPNSLSNSIDIAAIDLISRGLLFFSGNWNLGRLKS
jgi:hypothetical protein